MQDIVISSEADAVQFLEQYLKDPDSITISNIQISGWEKFNIHLSGEKFHNSITPSVMKGIIELQTSLYQTFAIAVYGEGNTSLLTKEQKKQLEITVLVTEGTTNLDIDVNDLFQSLIAITAGKMTSTQVFALLVLAITCYFGHSAWKSWLEKRNEKAETESDANIQKQTIESMTEMNKRTIDVLEQFAEQNSKAKSIYVKSLEAKNQVIKATHFAEEVELNGIAKFSGEQAEYLTRQPRQDWEVVRIDGRYRLLQVNSSNTRERKITLRSLDTGREFTAALEDTTLEKRHLEKLELAEWNHHPLQLKIKAKMKQGDLKEAIIISVEEVETDIVFDDSKSDDGDN